jgi:hypothetical protein
MLNTYFYYTSLTCFSVLYTIYQRPKRISDLQKFGTGGLKRNCKSRVSCVKIGSVMVIYYLGA